MKFVIKKLFIALLVIISVLCTCLAFAACGSGGGGTSTVDMQDGIVYLTDFSVKFTGEEESPYGDIDDGTLSESKTGGVIQNYYLVMDFDMQTASNLSEMEYLTVEFIAFDSDVVGMTINYADTSSVSETTADGQTAISATFSLPDKAKSIKSARVVLELKPQAEGSTDIIYTFSSDTKSVNVSGDDDVTVTVSSDRVSITKTSLYYALNSDYSSYTVYGIGSKSSVAYIKNTHAGLPVTAIASRAFYNNTSLTSIYIPDNVTSIGSYAFYGCTALSDITVSSGNANYKSVDGNLYNRGGSAIIQYAAGKTDESFELPENLTSINSYAFSYCTADILCGGSGKLTEISAYAFADYLGKKIVLPDCVTAIGGGAFYGCTNLENLNIPSGIVSIGKDAFYNCTSLVYYEYENACYLGNDTNNCLVLVSALDTSVVSVNISENTKIIYAYAFKDCSSLTDITIADGLTSISDYAFYGCSVKSITIPDSVVSIGSYAFYECTSLESIAFGGNVKTIGSYAFYKCRALTSITIPDSVTAIGEEAFESCSAMTDVTIGDGVTSIGKDAFDLCNALKNVYVSDLTVWLGISFSNYASNPLKSGGNLYVNGKIVTDLVIPDGVTSIGAYAFYGCSLDSITIPDGVTSIGAYAFRGCSVQSLTIGNGVSSVGVYMFENCTSLVSVVIGNNSSLLSQTRIGGYAFIGCSSLESAVIGDGVTSIGDYAFHECEALKTVTIGGNVQYIGERAFYSCTSLTSVTIPSSVTFIGWHAFRYCSSLTSVTFENTSGWYLAEDTSDTSGKSISLSDAGKNATYIVETYYDYVWKR